MTSNDSGAPIIHWYSHPSDRESTEFVADAMLRFEREVTRQTDLPIIVRELPDESMRIVNDLLARPQFVAEGLLITSLFKEVKRALPNVDRLVLFCPNAPTVRRMAQQEMNIEHLPWGVARVKQAFVFESQIPQVIWHEALHTIGAGECYDPADPRARFPLCTDPRCLMQFEPTPTNCGGGFPICSRVLDHIRMGLEHF
ncbi:MAG TPA: hypothetical protein PLY87_07100 [Planctomycetaceae bacterium]|nr:hypothetical protein [Planctomycetaceae bacterium]